MFKEGSEPDIYRDNLAEELKEAPKKERREILEKAKGNPEYQVARNKKIEGSQDEEEIDDGMGVFIKNKNLYHGSATQGIKEFKKADDVTVGDGVYLTSKAKDAIGYSHERVRRGKEPIIYEVSIENLKLLDLREDENVKKVMEKYKPIVKAEFEKMQKIMSDDEERKKYPEYPVLYPGHRSEFMMRALKCIWGGRASVGTIQEITGNTSDIFTDFAKSLGYDGLITIEGGEGNHRGNHDSYVVFDSEKVKVVKEQKIEKEN